MNLAVIKLYQKPVDPPLLPVKVLVMLQALNDLQQQDGLDSVKNTVHRSLLQRIGRWMRD